MCTAVQLLPVSCPGLTSDGYLCADGRPPGCRDYEEHLYVNTQSLENWEPENEGAQESPKKDLFDMSECAALWGAFSVSVHNGDSQRQKATTVSAVIVSHHWGLLPLCINPQHPLVA